MCETVGIYSLPVLEARCSKLGFGRVLFQEPKGLHWFTYRFPQSTSKQRISPCQWEDRHCWSVCPDAQAVCMAAWTWCPPPLALKVQVSFAQLYLTLYDLVDCSPPGSSVHGISQARILEWVAVPFSRGSSRPRIEPESSALQADSLPLELPGKPLVWAPLKTSGSGGSSGKRAGAAHPEGA